MNKIIVSTMIATVALFFTVTVLNNVVDYTNTFAFIEHTLSMDTTKQNPHFMWRAISNPMFQHFAFVGIILIQALIAGLCWWGVAGTHGTKPAMLGLTLGFALYAIGFVIIAGQWFMMRESATWNVIPSVHVFLTVIVASIIIVKLFDKE